MKTKRQGIDKIVKKLPKILGLRKEIATVYLFGSFGTEFQTTHSDIDFGIVFTPYSKVDLTKELELDAALSMAFETDKIDLVNLNKAPIQLRYRAVTEGQLVYEGDYIATSNFLEETYKWYLDYAYHLKVYEQEYNRALKEAYGSG